MLRAQSEEVAGRPRAPRRRGGEPGTRLHRNLRLLLEYEGTRYRGWQFQPRERTVMGELHNAVQEALGEQPVLVGAGRTDAGVHANGQVANFYTASTLPPVRIAALLNERLPHDIVVLDAADVPMGFHARHDALSRTYRYQIALRKTAFFKTTVYWPRVALDPGRMSAAARDLVGRHDFRSFADVTPGEGSEVELLGAEVHPHDFLLLVHLRAERFLWKMARRITGVLIEIGAGRLPPGAIRDFLRHPARSAASHSAPASGLFLEGVEYPPEGESRRRAGGRLSAGGSSRRIRTRRDGG